MAEPLVDDTTAGSSPREDAESISCLMALASHGHRVLHAALLAEIDLYPGQDRVLNALWDNGPQAQSRLAAILGIDMSTMTKSLQRLERSGLVSRSPCPTNRRISIVSTTPKGDALEPEVRRIDEETQRRMTRGLTPEQEETLRSLLAVIRANVCPQADSPGS
ncbi:MarR family winged helix-turn-helix transcriptional regulator [Sphaerimonospora sp. CA-214678]|uniref:MarR family winged helix-turn-helix transcriptional regulator n=1 Tax=Sphaerimonospora sp. CA-214678 TaxID=3240029 RepID=UPI003D8CDACB